jgi:hypothetical protein
MQPILHIRPNRRTTLRGRKHNVDETAYATVSHGCGDQPSLRGLLYSVPVYPGLASWATIGRPCGDFVWLAEMLSSRCRTVIRRTCPLIDGSCCELPWFVRSRRQSYLGHLSSASAGGIDGPGPKAFRPFPGIQRWFQPPLMDGHGKVSEGEALKQLGRILLHPKLKRANGQVPAGTAESSPGRSPGYWSLT